jgi:hypothetical protein
LKMRREKQNIELTAHVNDEGRPLCNQDGNYLHLCEPDEFERLPKECRCQRCEPLFRSSFILSNSKQHLLTEISRKTPNQDSWCPVVELYRRKTEAELTSLNRSLRQLELEGLVEMKESHNKSFVRLSDKRNSTNLYLLDVFQMRE